MAGRPAACWPTVSPPTPPRTVCLLEAGPPDRSPLIYVPVGTLALLRHKVLNWQFDTAPQAEAGNRSIYIPRGRALGGSHSSNGMVYIRGHRLDYDDWAAAGNPGWSYDDVLPYFKKSENNEQFGSDPFHGQGGPLNVTDVSTRNKLDDVFLEATDSMQLRRCRDFNGAEQEGFGLRQFKVRNGRRASTA